MKHLLFLLALLAWAEPARTAEPPKPPALTVEQYCQLSLERLELARSCWYWLRDGPTADQLKPLWAKYGTSEKDYMAFGSRNGPAIDRYFEARPELKARVDALSSEIREYVQRRGRDRAPAASSTTPSASQNTTKGQDHEDR